jgi:phosphonoacetate hydrolase
MTRAERIVVAVFDGLRPDLVRPDLTPNILRVAARGARFARAHSVFPSLTRVATSSISTGAPPRVHGIMGNQFWHLPSLPDRALDTSKFSDLARLGATDPAGILTATTLGEELARHGKQMAVVHSGSSGSAFLINPKARENGHWTFSIHGRDFTVTPEAVDAMMPRFGALPDAEIPRYSAMTYATEVFLAHVLGERDPDVALIWYPEPDTSFHYREIGSKDSLAALEHADSCFGRILDRLEETGAIERTAVLVLSDHGQITVTDAVPLYERMAAAGFDAAKQGAEVAIVGTSGASGELRLRHHDPAVRDRLAAFLAEQPEVAMVFSRGRNGVEGEAPGTLALDLLDLNHARAPDLAFVLASSEASDHLGLPGIGLYMGGDVPSYGGMHGGLNRYELATVLMLAGAGIEEGVVADSPAGLMDVAPTILALLGLPAGATMTGRVLAEAFGDGGSEDARTEAHEVALGDRRQVLVRHHYAGRRYLSSGGAA